jgi:hypothetical protein
VTDNEMLLDVEMLPAVNHVTIEDVMTEDMPGVPDGVKTEIWCWSTRHSINVYTMGEDESDATGRLVRVRVYRGTDTAGLGERVFDGELELTTGILAVGSDLGAPPDEQQLNLGPGIVRLQIFTEKAIQTVHNNLPQPGEYPISGPTDVNVLVLPT